jgi:hypothetical protein
MVTHEVSWNPLGSVSFCETCSVSSGDGESGERRPAHSLENVLLGDPSGDAIEVAWPCRPVGAPYPGA